MFRGRYQHTIDPKGRLSVPAKFRDALAQYEDHAEQLIVVPNEHAWRSIRWRSGSDRGQDERAVDVRPRGPRARPALHLARQGRRARRRRPHPAAAGHPRAGRARARTSRWWGAAGGCSRCGTAPRFEEYERTNGDALPSLFEKLLGVRSLAVHVPVLVDEVAFLLRPRERGLGDRRDGGDGRTRGGDAGGQRGRRAPARARRRSRGAAAAPARGWRASATACAWPHASFADLSAVAAEHGVDEAQAVLLDLGISS